MVRDGRASVYSLLLKNTQKAINSSLFMKHLTEWNLMYKKAWAECLDLTDKRCLMIKYENLITNPETVLRNLCNFLHIEFTQSFLQHYKYIGSKIFLENNGWSSDQVKKPIYKDSLMPWIGKVSYNKSLVNATIEMLHVLDYNIDFGNHADGARLNQ
jgi:hypothetical protein